MPITSDWHIHSLNSCDEASLSVASLIAGARLAGIEDFGLTDHLHTPYNLPDIAASRKDFLASRPSARFHFGVEVSCVSQWELDEIAAGKYRSPVYGVRSGGPPGAPPAVGLSGEDVERCGIEYVLGGTHWPLYVPWRREAIIRDYHRQNMFLATHPLVDIVAHPWWWMGRWQDADGLYRTDPWLDDFRRIPASMHDEFARAAKQYGTAIEINVGAMLLNRQYTPRFVEQYLDYLAYLDSVGVALAVGSDCHAEQYEVDFEATARMLSAVGISTDGLWRLPPRGEENA